MADQPDLAELARRYLDLWREQARLVGDDPVFASLVESLGAAAKQAADAAAGRTNGSRGGTAAGAKAARGPARDGEPDGDDLARRLAACEKRILRLERELEKLRGGAGAAPRRRRSRKAD